MVKPQTLEITHFDGRLTRKLNGNLNSGLAKFTTSFGYDPFSKPENLTWFEQPTSIASGVVTDLILAAKTHSENGLTYVYAVGNAGKVYRIQPNTFTNPNLDSVLGVVTLTGNSPTFDSGAAMEFYGTPEKLYVSNDNQINVLPSIASGFAAGDTKVGTTGYATTYHPLKQQFGKLLFGNGNTIGAINTTGTITSSIIGTGQGNLYSEINPPLPVTNTVRDLDATMDGNYLLITASTVPNESIDILLNDNTSASGGDGYLYRYNGTDAGITSFNTIPSYAITALQTYLQSNLFFSNDSFGAALSDGTQKLLTLPGNKAPLPNATLVNGNFVCWISPEMTPAGGMSGSMYYFGSLDQENTPGLYRVLRYTSPLANGFVYQTPTNLLTNNKYSTINASRSSIVTIGYGKHYFSTFETSNSVSNSYKFLRFLITSSGTGTPQLGVYETQTQLFSKRITVKQLRVYTEPTVASNGFQIDCIGSDGSIITNGTFTYTYAAGTDVTLLQGALERIDFNPSMNDTFALGIRITNTGGVNMTIKKIEIDWSESGK